MKILIVEEAEIARMLTDFIRGYGEDANIRMESARCGAEDALTVMGEYDVVVMNGDEQKVFDMATSLRKPLVVLNDCDEEYNETQNTATVKFLTRCQRELWSQFRKVILNYRNTVSFQRLVVMTSNQLTAITN